MAAERRKPARRERRLSREERELWQRAMRDVAARGEREPPPEEVTATAESERRERPPRPASRGKAVGAAPGRAPSLPPLAAGRFPGLDRRTAERLRRGRLTIEASVDLHGLSQAEAQRALAGFLAEQAARGRRCVLVVTGKGRIGEDSGVLRRQVPRWLNLAPNRGQILGFVPAQPRHGGEGALYVLLKRHRE